MRALLLFLAALLVGVSPDGAFAHNGENHQLASDAQGATRSVTAERHVWTPVCPPGSGHVCTCDNLSLSDAGAKPALVIRCTVSFLPPCAGEAACSAETGTKSSPQFLSSLPRAPPLV